MPLSLLSASVAWGLTLARLAGFVVSSPFPGSWVPARARVALTLTLALALSPVLPAGQAALPTDGRALPLVVSNLVVGLLIGVSFRFMLAAAELMAGMVSQAAYLTTPASFNPQTGGQATVLSQIAILFALMVALGMGAHRVVIAYLMQSFQVIPLGGSTDLTAGMPAVFALVGRSFDVGMRLALPTFAVAVVVQGALALVARVAPTLQIFNIGFAVLVVAGLTVFAASMPGVGRGLVRYLSTLPDLLDAVLTAMAGL